MKPLGPLEVSSGWFGESDACGGYAILRGVDGGSRANTWVIDDQPWALIVEELLKLVGAEYRVPDE